MELSSVDLCNMSVQEVLDMLIEQDAEGVEFKGIIDGEMCTVYIRIEVGAVWDE